MTHTIAIAHHAGGVGKTTTALNLGYSLAATQADQRVLLTDLDPQADLSQRLRDHHRVPGLREMLLEGRPPAVSHRRWQENQDWPGFDLLGSDLTHMAGIELTLMNEVERERCLARGLAHLRRDYHYILLDCPPSLTLLTVNALYAAEWVLVPVQAQDKAVRQLTPLLQTVKKIQRYRDGAPALLGIVLTMVDRRTRQSRESETVLRETYGDLVCETVIPFRVLAQDDGRWATAPGIYAPDSDLAAAYTQLAQEVVTRVETAARPTADTP